MNGLGYMYVRGFGVKQDHTEAVRWWRKAADRGNAPAMNNLGIMYEEGLGVKQDSAEARQWYQKAAAKGYAGAKAALERLKEK